jgi:hypothetical protein
VEALVDALTKIVLPLLTLDKAELYVVNASSSDVHLHVAGAYSGCPGVGFVTKHLLTPVVAEVFPKATLVVTSGRPIPADAKLLT